MTDSEILCERVDDNIRNLSREWSQLTQRREQLGEGIDKIENDLRATERQRDRTSLLTGVSRAGRVIGGSVGAAVTVFGAIAGVNEADRLDDEINALRGRLARAERALDDVDRQRGQKLDLIRDQQQDFNGLGCFDLGFSHDVLNLP